MKYELNNLEVNNINFNNDLLNILKKKFNLNYINENILREYYILNDYDYLNNKHKNNIKLNIFYYLNFINNDLKVSLNK